LIPTPMVNWTAFLIPTPTVWMTLKTRGWKRGTTIPRLRAKSRANWRPMLMVTLTGRLKVTPRARTTPKPMGMMKVNQRPRPRGTTWGTRTDWKTARQRPEGRCPMNHRAIFLRLAYYVVSNSKDSNAHLSVDWSHRQHQIARTLG